MATEDGKQKKNFTNKSSKTIINYNDEFGFGVPLPLVVCSRSPTAISSGHYKIKHVFGLRIVQPQMLCGYGILEDLVYLTSKNYHAH